VSGLWDGPLPESKLPEAKVSAAIGSLPAGSLKNRRISLIVGASFAILIALLITLGYLGVNRMDRIGSDLDEIFATRWSRVQLAREALMYSNRNSRIVMEVFFVSDKQQIASLLTTRVENSQKISELVAQLERRCDSPEERQLLAAVKETRAQYIASYVRALHLLVDEQQPEAAHSIMVQETAPALHQYHDAWTKYMQFEMEQMNQAAIGSRARYARTRALALLVVVLAVIVAVTIAFFVTLRMTQEMRTRLRAERAVRKLNAGLERRVEQRTRELAHSNQRLMAEMAERRSAEDRMRLQAAALQAAANSIVITDLTGTIL